MSKAKNYDPWEVVASYTGRKSLRQTAKVHGVSAETVRQVLLKLAPDLIEPPHKHDRKRHWGQLKGRRS